jgi:cytochrome c-type biogenesis protein CcmF
VAFYQSVSIPLAFVMLLLMAVSPALRWARQEGTSWIRALAPALLVGAVIAGLAFLVGLRASSMLALVGLAAFALGMNAIVTVRYFRRGWEYGAGYLGHFGIAVMVLGMVLSGALGKSERVKLPQGRPVPALGYTLVYQGEETDARGRQMLRIQVTRPGFTLDARPKLFASPRGEGVMREPALGRRGELYLSAMETIPAELRSQEPVWLEKGHEVVVGDVGYTFIGFRMESGRHVRVLADLAVRRGDRVEHVFPGMDAGPSGTTPFDVELAGMGPIGVARIDADRHRVAVTLPGMTATPATAVVDFSTKPLIHLVWMGALLGVLGTALAGLRRARERTPLPERKARKPRAASAAPIAHA